MRISIDLLTTEYATPAGRLTSLTAASGKGRDWLDRLTFDQLRTIPHIRMIAHGVLTIDAKHADDVIAIAVRDGLVVSL